MDKIQSGEQFRTRYDVKRTKLGEGGFGSVYLTTERASGQARVVKIVRSKAKAREEVQIVARLNNEFIIRFFEAFENGRELMIVMEYLEGGELFDKIAVDDELLESDCCSYIRQICQGLEYLHGLNIVHLDIKPENIMLVDSESMRVKIIDFGSSMLLSPGEQQKSVAGTPEFMAPEVVSYEAISSQTDQWSLGIMTYILVSDGFSPFLGDDDNETSANITAGKYDFDPEKFDVVSPNAKDFISRLIQRSRRRRLTARECLDHSWLTSTFLDPSKRIKIANLKNFLARRKVQNVGRALKVINVFKAAVKESRSSCTSSNSSFPPSYGSLSEQTSGVSVAFEKTDDERDITSSLSDLVREACLESDEDDNEDIPVFVETVHTSDAEDTLEEKEENKDRLQPLPSFKQGNVKLKRTSSKPVAGTVRKRLQIFAEHEASAPAISSQEKRQSVGKQNKDFMKYEIVEEKARTYKRASTKPAPGTVKNLSKKFEQGSKI